jgi:hypothetical protein
MGVPACCQEPMGVPVVRSAGPGPARAIGCATWRAAGGALTARNPSGTHDLSDLRCSDDHCRHCPADRFASPSSGGAFTRTPRRLPGGDAPSLSASRPRSPRAKSPGNWSFSTTGRAHLPLLQALPRGAPERRNGQIGALRGPGEEKTGLGCHRTAGPGDDHPDTPVPASCRPTQSRKTLRHSQLLAGRRIGQKVPKVVDLTRVESPNFPGPDLGILSSTVAESPPASDRRGGGTSARIGVET